MGIAKNQRFDGFDREKRIEEIDNKIYVFYLMDISFKNRSYSIIIRNLNVFQNLTIL